MQSAVNIATLRRLREIVLPKLLPFIHPYSSVPPLHIISIPVSIQEWEQIGTEGCFSVRLDVEQNLASPKKARVGFNQP